MITPVSGDPTPVVGAATDVTPVGRAEPRPAHELTADEDPQLADWQQVEQMPEFKALMVNKAKFVVPACVFFVIYYFALPVSVGWFPQLMHRKVFGLVNVAYLFALSQFFVAWLIAAFYVRAAARFDKDAADIIGKIKPR